VPSAITLLRRVNENAFVIETQTRPCPTFGRPVHRGFPLRLRPGTSPHALRIPPHGGHPALRSTTSSGFSFALAVSSFRLRARLDVCIPSAFFGQRGITPLSDIAPLIWAPEGLEPSRTTRCSARASRIPPWLASGWGCPDRRPSKSCARLDETGGFTPPPPWVRVRGDRARGWTGVRGAEGHAGVREHNIIT
jgi:hypothetical protein